MLDKFHRPHSKHPNVHTDEDLKQIQYYHSPPKIFVCELYGKLHTAKGYTQHPSSLYCIFRKLVIQVQLLSQITGERKSLTTLLYRLEFSGKRTLNMSQLPFILALTAKILSVTNNWWSIQKMFHLSLHGAKQLLNSGSLFKTCHSLLWLPTWNHSN